VRVNGSVRWRHALVLALVLATTPACSLDASDLANFIDTPFGDVSAEVTKLDDPAVTLLMDELLVRFRMYLALREAIPFGSLAPQTCMTTSDSFSGGFSFTADVDCTFGDLFAPASGSIDVRQEQLAETPVVVELDVTYRNVQLGDLSVSGSELINETDTSDGASIRTLDLVQDDIVLGYEFRLGLLDGDVPVFDYRLKHNGNGLIARITNPQSAGAFVTVFLIGIDGQLTCEVRDTAWTVDNPARGVCDNGVVFGLPAGPEPQ
jgi:hypothetical protein